MASEKIRFSKEKETMLMTLSGRALQSQWKQPILRDPWAEAAMTQIDYDIRKQYRGPGSWKMWEKIGCTIIATRAATFDLLAKRYLAEHPDAVVLHVGCGMDSRVFRLDPPASVLWFDIDYPDVIDLRRRLFPDRETYRLIGASLSDLHWLDEVPRERPGLLIAEGVLHYLSEPEVKALLNAVVAHFPSGQLIFDICNRLIVKRAGSNVGGTGAAYRWGLDDPQDIRQLEPKLDLVKELKPSELVAFSRFPFWVRVLFRLMEISPTLWRTERIIVYRYGQAGDLDEARALAQGDSVTKDAAG
ncbi:class I SAM-dependent methyltransferase [Thermogemmatispora carboxidivorans]|uniref:class I SAM-dependent methyltransferase n=1 Tax=Thermogemmatispora carboxidivorans TaxID=1382306 RepID=UPI00069B0C88|nr:class I SAM-dependent methyltransferase [Thermogemmatispora carboxidivorans]